MEDQARGNCTGKRGKGIWIRKKEVKLFLFVGGISYIYVEILNNI